jgi:hypothetical protein
VLGKLSRSSSPGVLPAGSSRFSTKSSAPTPARQQPPGLAAKPEAALAADKHRQLHEQALAKLVVLAGPASALRPPELPSAGGTADAAEACFQEQPLPYARPSPSPLRPARPWGAVQARPVGRTATAPPDVGQLLTNLAEEQEQQAGFLLHDGDSPPLPEGSRAVPDSFQPAVSQLPSVPSGLAMELGGEDPDGASLEDELSGLELGSGGAWAAAAGQHPPCGSALLPENGACDASHPDAATAAAAAAPGAVERKPRPSIMHWLMSAAGAPWRGRSVSHAPEARPSISADEPSTSQRHASTLSVASMATGAPSLAELSSECLHQRAQPLVPTSRLAASLPGSTPASPCCRWPRSARVPGHPAAQGAQRQRQGAARSRCAAAQLQCAAQPRLAAVFLAPPLAHGSHSPCPEQ